MRQVLYVVAALLISGCADQSPANTTAAVAAAPAASSTQVCRKEQVIGSNLPQTVCHSVNGDPRDAAMDQEIRDVERASAQQVQSAHH